MREQRRTFYRQQADTLAAEISHRRKRNTAFVAGELGSFLLAIGAVAAYLSTDTGYTLLYIAAAMLAAYLVIRYRDTQNSNRIEELEHTHSVYRKELAYLAGQFEDFGDGARYADPQHPFALDMDVFGRDSLFNRINRTVTTGGSDRLARELTEWPSTQLADRAEAIDELAEAEPLRTRFLAHGQQAVIDTGQVLAALQAIRELRLPAYPKSMAALIAAWAAIAGLLLAVLLAVAGIVPAEVPITWGVTQFCVVFVLHAGALRKAHKAVNKIHRQMQDYLSLMVLIAGSGLKGREHTALIRTLADEEAQSALRSFSELQSILDGLDRRGNQLGLFLSDAFACSDFFLVRRFLHWQERYRFAGEEWIEAVSRFDALVSMATFRYNEPSAVRADITGDDGVVFEGEALRHPFLGDRAVANDFSLADGHYYIVTGANMAGKSTFLRTVGTNYILARCGMPVFARRLRVSRFALFSSMRTTDDLTHGISYFNAELLRLQQLLAFCRQHPHTLIILDEILKGTNSLDKLNGSRLFLEHVSRLPVTGIIATHDLELSKMADRQPDRFHNRCFEIRLSDQVTYTYRITEGVARNQNATFLLRNIVLKESAAAEPQGQEAGPGHGPETEGRRP